MVAILTIFLSTAVYAIAPDQDYKEMLDRRHSNIQDFKNFAYLRDAFYSSGMTSIPSQANLMARKHPPTANFQKGVDSLYRDFLTFFYSRMSKKIKLKLGDYYYRPGTNGRLIIFVPPPHYGSPSENSVVIANLIQKFPHDHLLVTDNHRLVYEPPYQKLEEAEAGLSSEFRTAIKAFSANKLETVFFVHCFATPVMVGVLKKIPEMYSRAIFYAPMMKEHVRGRLFLPSEIYQTDTFPILDIIFYYYTALNPMSGIVPLNLARHSISADTKVYSLMYARYREGVDLSGVVRPMAILSEKDEVVPTVNSSPHLFEKVRFVKGSNHIQAVSDADKVSTHLELFEELLH